MNPEKLTIKSQEALQEAQKEDPVAILRGLKERYELHHGVGIRDSALVAAATLSERYITDRFLPDKAIDLVDEAASRLRMEIDSMPVELDETERRIRQLEIEATALRQEKDAPSAERLKDKRVTLNLSDAAKDYLSREGFDPDYGARPLKRIVQKRLVDPLAKLLLTGEVREGQAVEVDAGKSGLTFKAAKGRAKAQAS